jgi:hypothetical protein
VRPCVFIHTNAKQRIGALVSKRSIERNAGEHPDFDIQILHAEDHPFLRAQEGSTYLVGGERRVWRCDDLQSFTPLRFMPPLLMGYRGRALVIDPDIFATADVGELLTRDMEGCSILCRARPGVEGARGAMASSVMLLDCEKLTHWHCEQQFNELFELERDYEDWICLRLEPRDSIGLFEDEWNDFDRLTSRTRLLHNTKRGTQPWKTGLPVDFTRRRRFKLHKPKTWLRPIARHLGLGNRTPQFYAPHPDPNQERFFFALLQECLQTGAVTAEQIREEMRQGHVRSDAMELLKRTPPLAG